MLGAGFVFFGPAFAALAFFLAASFYFLLYFFLGWSGVASGAALSGACAPEISCSAIWVGARNTADSGRID